MQQVFYFGKTKIEGGSNMRDILGNKGAELAEMTKIGLLVPPGFSVSTKVCVDYLKEGKFPEGLWEEVEANIKILEQETEKKFGDAGNPLLVSVRSGAPVSMPGMMDTILNLGLNDEVVSGMIKLTDNPQFVYDIYRRLIEMFGDVVLKIEREKFENILKEYKERRQVKSEMELTANELSEVCEKFKEIIKSETQKEFPQEPYLQLRMAMEAVFNSWNNKRAIDYRNFNKIPHHVGTAVNVVTMIFGNLGKDSGTGVFFTRNPATGEKKIYGEYLLNAQGEDVVAGIRTPKEIENLQTELPKIYKELLRICEILEKHYKDVQDAEFTIEKGKLWMLQTRNGKRTPQAGVKIVVDLVSEGLIDKKQALFRINPHDLDKILHPTIDPEAKIKVIAKGLNASPGAASGIACFDASLAEEWVENGKDVILIRPETDPDDIHGMLRAKGILTQHGGATSHAAVVARGLGKPCVAGCEALNIDLAIPNLIVGEFTINQGDEITINGTTGEVILGRASMVTPEITDELKQILLWADEIRKLGVLTNADNPKDAKKALEYGAEGIGLCRTEHMFFEKGRRPVVVGMIMANTDTEKQQYLDRLLPLQRQDFEEMFEVMDGKPVTIRLIDPPMHEFLPKREQLIEEIAILRCQGKQKELKEKEKILKVVENLWEVNPMLGLRGCRLGLTFPQISAMQVRAIFEAACNMTKKGIKVFPKIMIPLVCDVEELKLEKERLEKIAKDVMQEKGIIIDYKFGTMIELPRAALTADKLAKVAQFFSFGTNDLTQTTYGISRDDAEGKFLLKYVEKGILKENPFQVLDREGVGKLIRVAVDIGKKQNKDLDIGICGEHGGDPSSIEFCHSIGLDYVSCSPFRVPVARLAAAQAVLKEN